MRVLCPNCGGKAVITHSEKQSDVISTLYCCCKNSKDCAATFVFMLSFNHYLIPPIKTTQDIELNLLRSLPKEQLKELLKQK